MILLCRRAIQSIHCARQQVHLLLFFFCDACSQALELAHAMHCILNHGCMCNPLYLNALVILQALESERSLRAAAERDAQAERIGREGLQRKIALLTAQQVRSQMVPVPLCW